ncbi:MAG: hypothetical protein ACYDHH_16285 [Solirubrobacteraceae bacterium]
MRAHRLALLVFASLAVAGPTLGVATQAGGQATSVSPPTLPGAGNCPVLPADNPWNQRVDALPVARNSAALISSIGLGNPVHPDFGSGNYNGAPIGIPYTIVSNATRKVPVSFDYAGESDKGPYPIPPNVPIEGGRSSSGDRHVIVVNKDTCVDYELYATYPRPGGKWHAGSGAVFNLHSDHLRPAGWTSADAAGLPILPGLARYDEVAHGVIGHALRFTAPCTAAAYVYPARHQASTCHGANLPPMGLRVRLKANVNISGLPHQARVVAQALKTYGLILADNGSPWYISGAPDPRWSNDALHQLDQLTGKDFEVVDTSGLPHPGL